jgi:glutamate carboxypeptidase
MVSALESLVTVESPSDDGEALTACASVMSALFSDVLGSAPSMSGTHLVWPGGGPCRVLLLGHYDTVWPLGTLAARPFDLSSDGRAVGPGCFDMKAGIVQLIFGLATLESLEGVSVLLTSDEETGSGSSRALVESMASGALAALVLEPSAPGGALKTGRKGTGTFRLTVAGRAAHAGLEPEKGANALLALAALLPEVAALARPSVGTTVTPTTASAGAANNVVPAAATAEVDVRVTSAEEAARLEAAMRALESPVADTTLTVSGGLNRPPMPASAAAALFGRASVCATRLGLGPLSAAEVGGGSDGNFTAAVGTPTLDGLGAVGDGAHSATEYVCVDAMPERAALLAELVEDLLAG